MNFGIIYNRQKMHQAKKAWVWNRQSLNYKGSINDFIIISDSEFKE